MKTYTLETNNGLQWTGEEWTSDSRKWGWWNPTKEEAIEAAESETSGWNPNVTIYLIEWDEDEKKIIREINTDDA